MGKMFSQGIAILVTMVCLSIGCTPVPDDHAPSGVYPTFVDLDATSGKVTPQRPTPDAEEQGAEDTGVEDTGASSDCPGICNINPNNPACVNCP